MKKLLVVLFLIFVAIAGFFLIRSWVNKVSDTIEAIKPTPSVIETYSPYQDNTAIPAQKPCPNGDCKG